MTLLQLTVEIEATPEGARLLAAQAGFTVKRLTQPRVTTPTTAPHPFVRASAVLDRPDGLDRGERRAYNRGYAAGCLTYVKKHGIPRGDTYAAIVSATRQAEWDRHPAAHTKGLAELAAYRRRTEAYLAGRAVAAAA